MKSELGMIKSLGRSLSICEFDDSFRNYYDVCGNKKSKALFGLTLNVIVMISDYEKNCSHKTFRNV